MKNKHFIISPEARDDLFEIQQYIAKDNHKAAEKVTGKIFEAFALLSANPFIGAHREDLLPPDVYFWTVYSYLIIYDPHVEPINIVRVVHGNRDISRLFNEEI